MYCFSSQKVPAAQSVSDRGEMVSPLNWERKSDCKGMRGDSAYQKKKEKLAQQHMETRAGEDHLAHGEGCSDQVGRLEAKGVLQQGAKGEEDPLEASQGSLGWQGRGD
ncbi:uncharacterized protein LOC134295877 isoform X2 [Anolis carolinensis]|uniref:uncharacterized protein LOC134295877 isoform X2 n=1 Tax=Anolis carolinensis TaxID=28377 RepID=UPI002F2B337E